jgi:sortase (surface protein transpeptidase)
LHSQEPRCIERERGRPFGNIVAAKESDASSRPFAALDRATASQEVDHEDHQRNDEQKVNQSAANASDQTEKPEHQQNHKNRPKHFSIPPFDLEPKV